VEFRQAAQEFLLEDLPHREEVSIPTTILKDAQDAADFFRQRDELVRIGGSYGEGLVDDHVLPGLQGLRRDFQVTGVGGGDDDEFDGRFSQQRIEIADNLRLRISLLSFVAPAFQDVGEPKIWVGVDEWAMEYLTRHSEADETNVDVLIHVDILSATGSSQKSVPVADRGVYNPHSAHSNS
jgi:hypothetical protein